MLRVLGLDDEYLSCLDRHAVFAVRQSRAPALVRQSGLSQKVVANFNVHGVPDLLAIATRRSRPVGLACFAVVFQGPGGPAGLFLDSCRDATGGRTGLSWTDPALTWWTGQDKKLLLSAFFL